MTTDTHNPIELSKVKKGEYVRLKIDGPVYVREHYCREDKKFCLSKVDDMMSSTFKKGKTIVFIGFDY